MTVHSSWQSNFKSRSMGAKLIVVCGLACLMIIPALLVLGVVEDRTKRAADVVKDISAHVGGQQTFLGPTLAIPYCIPAHSPLESAQHAIYLVFPAKASADVKTKTEERRRSIFKVPVYQSDLQFEAAFDLEGIPSRLPEHAEVDWSHAEIVVGVSDPRGALADATITIGDKSSILTPAQVSQDFSLGSDATHHIHLTLLGTNAAELIKQDAKFNVTSTLRFSGAQRLAVLAYGKTTNVTLRGDWPNPGFDGGFLPVRRDVSRKGFTAEWSVPFIARGVRAEGRSDSIAGLETTDLGVSFVELTDPYQSVDRSLKYIPLFLGLVFLSYFLFEVSSKKLIHPAQYVLVGVAQIIFYLLLLSLAERIGFDVGFLVAGAATVVLLSANAGWIFSSRLQATRALAVFAPLYTLIYLLLRLEDNALLVGSIASFAAVAAVMYFTRSIDWYGGSLSTSTIPAQPSPSGPRTSSWGAQI